MNWLYLISGGLALYSVETADINQPLHITALIALILCIIPTSIDAWLHSGRSHGFSRSSPTASISKNAD